MARQIGIEEMNMTDDLKDCRCGCGGTQCGAVEQDCGCGCGGAHCGNAAQEVVFVGLLTRARNVESAKECDCGCDCCG